MKLGWDDLRHFLAFARAGSSRQLRRRWASISRPFNAGSQNLMGISVAGWLSAISAVID